MAHKPGKYHRYVPSYRPAERWRQTTCNPTWIASYFEAWDAMQATGKRQPVSGFGGWHVAQPGNDIE